MNGQGSGDMSGFGSGEDMLDLGALFGGSDGIDVTGTGQGFGGSASQPSSAVDLQGIFSDPNSSSNSLAGPSTGGWMNAAAAPSQQQQGSIDPQQSQQGYGSGNAGMVGGSNNGIFANGQQTNAGFDAASMQYNPQLQQILQQQRLHQQQQQQQQQFQQAHAQNQQRWNGMSPGGHQGAGQAQQQQQQHAFGQQSGLLTPNQLHNSTPAMSFDPSQLHIPQQPQQPQQQPPPQQGAPGGPFGYSAQNLNPFSSPAPMGHMQQGSGMGSPFQHQQMTPQQQQQRQQLQQQQQRQQIQQNPQQIQQGVPPAHGHIDPSALSGQSPAAFLTGGVGMSPQQGQMYAPSPATQQHGSHRTPSVSNAMSPGQMTAASGASPPAQAGTPQTTSSTPVLAPAVPTTKTGKPRGRPRKKQPIVDGAANASTPSTVASPGPSRSASFSQQANGANQASTPTASHAPTPSAESAGPSAAPTPKSAAAVLSSGSTAAPSGPRPTGMQPQQLQQMLITQAYSQFAANLRAQDRARSGQAPAGPHHGGTLIPVNTVPGVGQVSWTPTVAPEVQQRFLEMAVQVAKIQAHTSNTQTSPSQILAAWGLMYIPPQAVPQGVPCSSGKGGAIVTLGDGRLLGVCGQEEQIAFLQILRQQMQNFRQQAQQRNIQILQWSNVICQHVINEQQKTLTNAQTLISNAMMAANAARNAGQAPLGMQPPNQSQQTSAQQQAQGQVPRPPQPSSGPAQQQQQILTPHQQAALQQQQQHQQALATAQAAALQRAQAAPAVPNATSPMIMQQQQMQLAQAKQLASAHASQALQPQAPSAGLGSRSSVPPSPANQASMLPGAVPIPGPAVSRDASISGQGGGLTVEQQLAAQAAAQATSVKNMNAPPVEGGKLPPQTGLGTKIASSMAQITALPPSLRKPDGTPAWTPLTGAERSGLRLAIVRDDEYIRSRAEVHAETQRKAIKWARELWSEPPKWTIRSIVPPKEAAKEGVKTEEGEEKGSKAVPAENAATKAKRGDKKQEGSWAWWEAPEDEDQLPQYASNHPQAREVMNAVEPFRIIMPAEKRERAMKMGSCGRASRLLAPTVCGGRNTAVATSIRDISASMPTSQAYQLVSTLPEELVPVRLEIDADGWKLRDTFTWNGADEHLPPELFAQVLCDEIALPHHLFVQPIIAAIQGQVRDHQLARVLREAGSGGAMEAVQPLEPLAQNGEDATEDVERPADDPLQASLIANGHDLDAPNGGITRLSRRAGEPLVGAGKLDAKSAKWWKKWRDSIEEQEEMLAALDGADGGPSVEELKRKRAQEAATEKSKKRKVDAEAAEDEVMEAGEEVEGGVEDPLIDEVLKDELRILVKLDITVGAMNLVDQFEWDLGDPRNSPEEFAATFAADLGLAGEFRTAIVHSIREQVAVHLNSLALVGHPFDGTPVADEDLRTAFLPSVAPSGNEALYETIMRNDSDVDAFTPRLLQLTEDEISRLDRERERDAKRKKRQTRGRRGVNLPDREPIKTQRTPVVHGLQTGALDTSESMATLAAATGLSSRPQRRAAVTAREGFNVDGTSSGTTSAQETVPSNALAPGGPSIKTRRFQLSNYAVQFAYPGGLGRADDPGGPRFTTGEAKDAPPTPVRPKAEPRAVRRASPPRDPAVEKALERQHPNVFNGMWHCSNCGIPATLTTSRRKGPAGDKSMCAPCGKHWNRYRKALDVPYSRDEEHHTALLANTKPSKPSVVSTSVRNSVLAGGDDEESRQREDSNATVNTANDASVSKSTEAPAPSVPNSSRGLSPELPFLQVGSPDDSNNSSSSRSPSPAPEPRNSAQPRGISPPKRSGAGLVEQRGNGLSISAPALVRSVSMSSAQNADGSPAPSSYTGPGASPPPPAATLTPAPMPPAWLEREMRSLSARYPNDRFDTLLKAVRAGGPPAAAPEWRIRCTDCPGKVYVPGPGETLENFMLHLRNRKHRAAVADRVAARSGAAGGSNSGTGGPSSSSAPDGASAAAATLAPPQLPTAPGLPSSPLPTTSAATEPSSDSFIPSSDAQMANSGDTEMAPP